MNLLSRLAVIPIVALAAGSFAPAAPARADPSPTKLITVVAVGPNGQPINGYREATGASNVGQASDCSTPSPSALADDVYLCTPTAAGAGTCWPSTPGSLLCVDNPWTLSMHRVIYDGPLPRVVAPKMAEPFALTLDDGTHCLLRNGGAWGSRADGYVGAFGCGNPGSNPAVLVRADAGPGSSIDRSSPVWTVQVGQLGRPDAVFPPPQTHAVTDAWFAGGKAGQ